jgi:hypothetical protein
MRDSIESFYIHGKEPDTDMITEEAYALIFFCNKPRQQAYLWDQGNMGTSWWFMSGPFINYAIIDKENNRVLVLKAFVISF